MRQSYLESYFNLIPKTQQDRLLSVLKRASDDAGQATDSLTLQSQLSALIAQLNKPLGEPLVQLRKAIQFGKISSKDYNNTMDEAYVDLGALFKQNNSINRTIKTHRLLNETVLQDIRSAMTKVENDIIVHKIVKENKTGITDVKFNSFYKEDNASKDSVYGIKADIATNLLKLPKGVDQSSLNIGGLILARIDVYHYGGGIKGTIEDESHRKERAIDESPDTFWGEVILTDEPVRQSYNGDEYFGTVCEVVVTLFRTDMVNHIDFNPFTNYPLDIVKIYYSSAIGGQWIDTGVSPQSSTLSMEFNFNEVLAKQIKIVINQRNPSINTYNIPKRVINNAQMWQQIVNREYSISTEAPTPIQATQDMIDYITGWQAYVDATEDFEKKLKELGKPDGYVQTQSLSESVYDAATQVLTKAGTGQETSPLTLDLYGKKPVAQDELVQVRKYEYVYGAYNIGIRKIWYLEQGEYISPPYIPNGTVMEARLDVTDVVPSGATIEYQVATREGEWKNILPSGGYITKERVDVTPETQTGYTRFPSNGPLTALYRNDSVVPTTDYTFNQSTGAVAVSAAWFVSSSAYTASYLPKGVTDVVPSGVVVSFVNDTLLDSDETYTSSDSRQYKVTLAHFPFVNYSVINDTSKAHAASPHFSYENGRWLNITGGSYYGIGPGAYYDIIKVTVDGFEAINRTDYYEDIRPALTQYDVNYPYYEYIHAGLNIYFNTPLSGKTVKVKYKYLNDFIQFRALLRNNVRGNVSITPILEDFTLKLRTI